MNIEGWAAEPAPRLRTSVTILSRLFHTADPDAKPVIYGPGNAPSSYLVYSFLTSSDRDLVSGFYSAAQDLGVDASDIDVFAFDLACYRANPDSVDTVGNLFDVKTGEPFDIEFKEPGDEAIAQRILTSTAMRDTRIPQDFLRSELDPGLKGGHAVDFAALERLVYATSSAGADGSHDPTAILAPRPAERLAAMKAAGLIPPAEQVLAGDSTIHGATPGGKYAERIGMISPLLDDDDKRLLSTLYAKAETGGPQSASKSLDTIDRLAKELVLQHLREALMAGIVKPERMDQEPIEPARRDERERYRPARFDTHA